MDRCIQKVFTLSTVSVNCSPTNQESLSENMQFKALDKNFSLINPTSNPFKENLKGDLVQHHCHGVRIKSSNFLIKTQVGPAIFYDFKKIEPFHIPLTMQIISCSMLLFS